MTKPENPSQSEESFWSEDEAAHVREEPDVKPAYDLEERAARFREAIIDFAKRMPTASLTERIIGQLVGAGTSVGANYDQADVQCQKAISKVHLDMQKEARQGKHFLRTEK